MATELELLALQARYNRWMNDHLFALCDPIPDEDRKRDMGAFFKSIHGTFNHLLLTDRVWLGRFTGQPFVVRGLDQELYADYGTLKRERRRTDDAIDDYLAGLAEEADLDVLVTYTSIVTRQESTYRLGDCLLHFFHHQTHHKGQITTLISQLGIDIGVTDLVAMPGVRRR